MPSQFYQGKESSLNLTLIGCLVIISTSFAYAMACQEPPSSDFEKQKQDLYFARDQHVSIFSLPGHIGNLMTLKSFKLKYPEFFKVSETTVYKPNIDCSKPDTPGLPPAQQNSTCPWYYVENSDPNRYPMEIWEARCSCDNCLEFNGNTQTSNLCRAVHYNLLVLRRKMCSDGHYVYREVLEPIQIGCMCTKINKNESTTPKPSVPPQ